MSDKDEVQILIEMDKETYECIKNLDALEEKEGIFPAIEAFNTFVEAVQNGKLVEVKDDEPKEITFDDVQRYCKSRCLTIITNELLYQFMQDTTNMGRQNTICKSHRIIGKHECCMADKGMPEVHCGGDKNKCEISDEED